jgi:hypothetical protein
VRIFPYDDKLEYVRKKDIPGKTRMGIDPRTGEKHKIYRGREPIKDPYYYTREF